MKLPKELQNLFFLLHDAIIDIVDDIKWSKEFTKDFDELMNKINWVD